MYAREDYVAELLKRGKVSASRATELLDISLYRARGPTRERGAEATSGSEEHDCGRVTAGRLLS